MGTWLKQDQQLSLEVGGRLAMLSGGCGCWASRCQATLLNVSCSSQFCGCFSFLGAVADLAQVRALQAAYFLTATAPRPGYRRAVPAFCLLASHCAFWVGLGFFLWTHMPAGRSHRAIPGSSHSTSHPHLPTVHLKSKATNQSPFPVSSGLSSDYEIVGDSERRANF